MGNISFSQVMVWGLLASAVRVAQADDLSSRQALEQADVRIAGVDLQLAAGQTGDLWSPDSLADAGALSFAQIKAHARRSNLSLPDSPAAASTAPQPVAMAALAAGWLVVLARRRRRQD